MNVSKWLETLGNGLMRWAGKLRRKKIGKIKDLEEKLDKLNEEE